MMGTTAYCNNVGKRTSGPLDGGEMRARAFVLVPIDHKATTVPKLKKSEKPTNRPIKHLGNPQICK